MDYILDKKDRERAHGGGYKAPTNKLELQLSRL